MEQFSISISLSAKEGWRKSRKEKFRHQKAAKIKFLYIKFAACLLLTAMSMDLYTFDYLRGECQPFNAGLFEVWKCYIFYMNVRGRWERLARGHKIEFVYSNFMGKFSGGYTPVPQLRLESCKEGFFWFSGCYRERETVLDLNCDGGMHRFYDNRIKVDYVCHQDNNITDAPDSIALEDEDELFADRVELEEDADRRNATQEDRTAGNKETSNKNSGELIRLAYQTLNQFAKKYRKKHSK